MNIQMQATPVQLGMANDFGLFEKLRCLYLLNDNPVLPGNILELAVGGYPTREEGGFSKPYSHRPVSRHEIESGTVQIVELDDIDLNGYRVEWLMYAWKKKMLVIHKDMDKGHWIYKHVIRPGRDIRVETVGEVGIDYFHGSWAPGQVILCDSYRIHAGGDSVEITEISICQGEGANRRYIVPKGDDSGIVVRQAKTVWTDFEYDDDSFAIYQACSDYDADSADEVLSRMRAEFQIVLKEYEEPLLKREADEIAFKGFVKEMRGIAGKRSASAAALQGEIE
jgi:hypothetical protein